LALEKVLPFMPVARQHLPLQEGDPEATAMLLELLTDTNPNVREVAVRGLREIGPPAEAAVPALLKLMNDDDLEVRIYAIGALASIGKADDRVMQALTSALTNKDIPELRYGAACAIAKFGEKATAALPQIVATVTPADLTLTAGGVDSTGLWDVRNQLADALGQMKTESHVVIPVLLAIAENERANNGVRDEALRCRAIQAIGNLGDGGRAALPALERIVKKEDLCARFEAKSSGVLHEAKRAIVRLNATASFTLPAGTLLSFGLAQNATTASWQDANSANDLAVRPHGFFALTDANPDAFEHFRRDRERYFVEDLDYGGDVDFDDMVFTIAAALAS
jgi:hypothetical protein